MCLRSDNCLLQRTAPPPLNGALDRRRGPMSGGAAAAGGRQCCLCSITGVVFQITSKVDDSLAAGDPVIVLESIKMWIPVEAPRAGKVIEIKVAEGQTVQEGDTVAVLN